jgi:hypothetical protein
MNDQPVIIVCVRDPDASNAYDIFERQADGTYAATGSTESEGVLIHDIDAGYSDLGNDDEFEEWAFSHLAAALDMPDPVAAHVRGIVESYAEHHEGWKWPTDAELRAGGREERYTARFHPQTWVGDHAMQVEPQGDVEWDVTDAFNALPDEYREELRALLFDADEANDHMDLLKGDENAPQWVQDWAGPFEVYVRFTE